jgi:CRISPR-associated protein Cmr2
VRRRLGENLGDFPGWDIRWETQIAQTWDVVTCVLALRDCSDEKLAEYRGKATFADAYAEAEKVRALGRSIPGSDRPGYAQDAVGRWQAQVELAGRLLAAARSVRHVPLQQQFTGEVPEKCTLLGSWERMGPGNRIKSGKFWAHVAGQVRMDGARVRPGEALCATALVKRFAVGAFLGRELGLTEHRDTFPDTATLAARLWLEQPEAAQVKAFSQQGNWNGQWLHWPSRDADEDDCCPDTVWQAIRDAKQRHDPPPTYYAVLMLDGDGMGDWLAGRNSPRLREALHPKLADYFGRLPGAQPGLDVPRPVSPSLHAAISEALGNFSQHVVPTIVETHGGALVYAGGDDVLALLPTERALACARALDRAFRGDEAGNNGAPPGYYRLGNGPDLLTMGRHASISAGIAVVHYKEDLRAALQWARDAERAAKNFGRNALSLTIARRSGEHASAALDWGLMDTLSEAVPRFRAASDRWAYRMRALLPVFQPEGPPEAAFLAELGRQIARGDDQATRELPVLAFYEQMRAAPGPPGTRTAEHWTVTAERLITLWQSASFLARGRDVAGRT